MYMTSPLAMERAPDDLGAQTVVELTREPASEPPRVPSRHLVLAQPSGGAGFERSGSFVLGGRDMNDRQFAHKPLHRAPDHGDALAVQFPPHLLRAIDLVVRRPYPGDLGFQLRIPLLPRPGRPGPGDTVRARCDLPALLGQHAADRLDTTEAITMLVDEPHERGSGRSSSATKKIEL